MTNDVLADVTAHGFLTRTDLLVKQGHSPRTIARAIERGSLVRVCRGWVATGAAGQAGIVAIAHGGRLTGTTALANRGVWDGVDRRIHVQLPVNGTGHLRTLATPITAFTRPKYPNRGLALHWAQERYPVHTDPPWRVSVVDALVCVSRTAPSDQFIACTDSALQTRVLSRAGIPVLFSLLPQHLRPLERELEPAAESGLESLARVRLRPIVRRIQSQVKIAGIARFGRDGRVDLLIDGWLVIELDGDEFHDQIADRQRNSILVRLGYRIHRFGYDQVVNHWAEVEATILELLRYPPARIPAAAR